MCCEAETAVNDKVLLVQTYLLDMDRGGTGDSLGLGNTSTPTPSPLPERHSQQSAVGQVVISRYDLFFSWYHIRIGLE
jgi:hypothetical protein